MVHQSTYARVSAFVRGRLRFLSGPNAPTSFTSAPKSSRITQDDLARQTNLPEAFITFLQAMDTKIETVLSLLRRGDLENDFPFTFETLEVSGSGMRFTSEASLIPNSYAEIILFLGDYPLGLASAVGKIQPEAPPPGSPQASHAAEQIYDSPKHPWVMQFTRIREADLDAIIQFVFQEERRKKRTHHWDR